MTRRFYPLTAFLLSAGAAHAHGGHVGELAGHFHWAGIAATLAAAALAALVAGAGKRRKTDQEDRSAEVDSEDGPEGAPA